MANAFRRLLINAGKAFPFVFALVVSIGYMETIFAVFTGSVLQDGGGGHILLPAAIGCRRQRGLYRPFRRPSALHLGRGLGVLPVQPTMRTLPCLEFGRKDGIGKDLCG